MTTPVEYTFWQTFFYFGGFVLWALVYVVVVVNIVRKKFVEVPVFTVCGNVAWEFLYSFIFPLNMLEPWLQHLYQIGFFLDCFIIYSVLRYGHKQIITPWIRKYFKPIIIFVFISWVVLIYFFVRQNYDLALGSNSAYILNIAISALYIILILNMKDASLFSMLAAWLKFLGTAFVTVFCFMKYSTNYFVLSMGIIVFILDVSYIWLLWLRQKGKLNIEATT